MKINYTFANGEISDVEVSEEIGTMILDSRREESNLDRKERYHCYSLDGAEFEGMGGKEIHRSGKKIFFQEFLTTGPQTHFQISVC